MRARRWASYALQTLYTQRSLRLVHRQSIAGLQWELQHDGFRGELEIFLPDGAVYLQQSKPIGIPHQSGSATYRAHVIHGLYNKTRVCDSHLTDDTFGYHVDIWQESAGFLQSSFFNEASTEAGMRGRYGFLRALHSCTRGTPMQETALRPVGKALILLFV